jgi:hypothetical protein
LDTWGLRCGIAAAARAARPSKWRRKSATAISASPYRRCASS